ncbi:AmmeMemoRadiSam system protein B [Candidatus Falkowbacteria bacterium]|nr:AmmeMemoRadiSam system protein B [Candidatus Falkowbacteria bacterium]
MIKTAAIVPHPLILIPNIGRENLSLLEQTIKAYQKLAEDLKEQEIESIVIFSSHGPIKSDAFCINLSEKFEINFEEFGDFATRSSIEGDLYLAQTIKEIFPNDLKVRMINNQVLDHASAVPLLLLCQELKDVKVVPIYISGHDLKRHFEFGKKIGKQLAKEKKKIAVIASGDLSHCLNKKAPAGYCPKGAKFDQKLIEDLKAKDPEYLLNTDNELLEEIRACGPQAISSLLGVLDVLDYETDILSYESPFGIGNLTARFTIQDQKTSS